MPLDTDAGMWYITVPSRSRKNRHHTVLVRASCTCEGFEHRRTCRHVKMVYDTVEEVFDIEIKKSAMPNLDVVQRVNVEFNRVRRLKIRKEEQLCRQLSTARR